MTLLTVWSDDVAPGTTPEPELRTTDTEEIRSVLEDLGVRYDTWPLQDLGDAPTQDEVLAAYRTRIDEVSAAEGYVMVDVVQMHPPTDAELAADPSQAQAWAEKVRTGREKFLDEHTHDDDEDRFFAAGSGVFYLHLQGKVHAVLCEAGDLLSVPGGTTHWFDMGTGPEYVSVRFFHDDDGWVGSFTGSGVSRHFPTYDELVASR